jgi:hypothetical protein
MEDIIETQEFHENDEIMPDKFLDDSFGMGLEFSRLIQNNFAQKEAMDDKQDIDMLLKTLQQNKANMSIEA